MELPNIKVNIVDKLDAKGAIIYPDKSLSDENAYILFKKGINNDQAIKTAKHEVGHLFLWCYVQDNEETIEINTMDDISELFAKVMEEYGFQFEDTVKSIGNKYIEKKRETNG